MGVGTLAATSVTCKAAQQVGSSNAPAHPLTLGLASYTLRKLSLEDTLAVSNRLNRHINHDQQHTDQGNHCCQAAHSDHPARLQDVAAPAARRQLARAQIIHRHIQLICVFNPLAEILVPLLRFSQLGFAWPTSLSFSRKLISFWSRELGCRVSGKVVQLLA